MARVSTIFSSGDDRTYGDVMHSDVLTTSPATCCVPSISDEASECDVMLSDLVALSADTYGILFQKCSDVPQSSVQSPLLVVMTEENLK